MHFVNIRWVTGSICHFLDCDPMWPKISSHNHFKSILRSFHFTVILVAKACDQKEYFAGYHFFFFSYACR